jgi:hypothetical protein
MKTDYMINAMMRGFGYRPKPRNPMSKHDSAVLDIHLENTSNAFQIELEWWGDGRTWRKEYAARWVKLHEDIRRALKED